MKTCVECKIEKELVDFYKLPSSADSYRSKCKVCQTEYLRKYYYNNRPRILEYKRKFNASERGQELLRGMKVKHRKQMLARASLSSAVRRGKVIKPTRCTACNSRTKLNGHHINYDEPLKVLWLCVSCHYQLHRKI